MQALSMDIQQLGRLARRDLERACRHFLSLDPADRHALLATVRSSPPQDWPEDLLGVLHWLEGHYDRLGLHTSPDDVLADAFQLDFVRHSPMQLLHRPLEPGDEISEVLARRIGKALIHLGGEGDRLICLDEAELHIGTQLGFLLLSRSSLRARRTTSEEQTALSGAWKALQTLKALHSSAARGLELRFGRLLQLRSEDYSSTLPRLEALTGLKRSRLWLEVVEYQRRQSFPADRRPTLLGLSERLEQVGIPIELPQLGRLTTLAASILARIMPDPEVASGVVQLKAPDLEEFLRWETGTRHLARFHSTSGVRTLNELLLTLASHRDVPGFPAEMLSELVEMREVFLMRLYEKPILALVALDPATLLRRALHPEPEHLWPELPTPGAMVEAWTDLERAILQKLQEVRMQPLPEPSRPRSLTERILGERHSDRVTDSDLPASERGGPEGTEALGSLASSASSAAVPRLLPAALRRPGSLGLAQPAGHPIPLVAASAQNPADSSVRPGALKPGAPFKRSGADAGPTAAPSSSAQSASALATKAPGVYRRSNEPPIVRPGPEQWSNPLEPAIPWPFPPSQGDEGVSETDRDASAPTLPLSGAALSATPSEARTRSPFSAAHPAHTDNDTADEVDPDALEHTDTISVIVSLETIGMDSIAESPEDALTALPFSPSEPEIELAPALDPREASRSMMHAPMPELPFTPDDSLPLEEEPSQSLESAEEEVPHTPADAGEPANTPDAARTAQAPDSHTPLPMAAEETHETLAQSSTRMPVPPAPDPMEGLIEAILHPLEPQGTMQEPEQPAALWVETLGQPASPAQTEPIALALTEAVLSAHQSETSLERMFGTASLDPEAPLSEAKSSTLGAQLEDLLLRRPSEPFALPEAPVPPQHASQAVLEEALSLPASPRPPREGQASLPGAISFSGPGGSGFTLHPTTHITLPEGTTKVPDGPGGATLERALSASWHEAPALPSPMDPISDELGGAALSIKPHPTTGDIEPSSSEQRLELALSGLSSETRAQIEAQDPEASHPVVSNEAVHTSEQPGEGFPASASPHEFVLPPLQSLSWEHSAAAPGLERTSVDTAHAGPLEAVTDTSSPQAAPSAPDPGGHDAFFFDGINLFLFSEPAGTADANEQAQPEPESAPDSTPAVQPDTAPQTSARIEDDRDDDDRLARASASPLEDAALWLNSTPMDPAPILESDDLTAFSDPLANPPRPSRVIESASAFVRRSSPFSDRVAFPEPPEQDEERQLQGAVFGIEAQTEAEEELSDPLPMPEGGADFSDEVEDTVEAPDEDSSVGPDFQDSGFFGRSAGAAGGRGALAHGRADGPTEYPDDSGMLDEIEKLMETLESAESLAAASTPWPVPWGTPSLAEPAPDALDPLEALELAEDALTGSVPTGSGPGTGSERSKEHTRPGSGSHWPGTSTRPPLNLAGGSSSAPPPGPALVPRPEIWETPREERDR